MIERPTKVTELFARIQTADPLVLARGLDLVASWDDDFNSRPKPTPAGYANELTLVALPRIARGHGGVAGVGVNLAEAILVLHLLQYWADDPLFASIVDAIASVAKLMRKEAA